jgi:hypothetical protein
MKENGMKVRGMGAVAIGLLVTITSPATTRGQGPAKPVDDLERTFREVPMEARRLTGPLFWLHGDESPERLRATLNKVAEGGNGTFTAESRPHSDWLGEGWYRDLGICLDEAKKLGLTMWIFDEAWWPSGEVGGKVPAEFASKVLDARAIAVTGPKRVEVADLGADSHLVAIIAGRATPDGIDGASLIDLTAEVRDGALRWNAPEGEWSVMTFTWKLGPQRANKYLVNGASRDAVSWYIDTVYKPHHDRFGPDFGKSIVGYFYDEPETFGDWGTEVRPTLDALGLDWKKAYVAYKFRLAGDDHVAARHAYLVGLAEAWGKTFYGGLTDWCRARGVSSIGHFLEHNHEYLDRTKCAGDMVRLMKYSDMGAIDAVFKQFVPGKKDDSTYQSPKLGSSISHVYGKADDLTMVEIFGARGQDLTYPEMKWWTNLMQVSGVNFFIPHSFNPRAPFDTDCPPYFYNGGYEPRFPLYRVFADYTTRMSTLMTGGHHVAPVAIAYLGLSTHVGRAVPPERLTTALQDALYDCDWLPEDALAASRIDGRTLALHGERYRVLVVPPVEVVPLPVLEKAKAFLDAGGVVLGHGFLPSRSATIGRSSSEVADLCRAIWGPAPQPGPSPCVETRAGGRSFFLGQAPTPEEIARVLDEGAGVRPMLEVLSGDTGHWLHALHRRKDGRDIILVCNQHVDGDARAFRLRVDAPGVPEAWCPMRGTVESVKFDRKGDSVEFDLTLEPLESVALVFGPETRSLPARIGPDTRPVRDPIAVERRPSPPSPSRTDPPLKAEANSIAEALQGLSWVWYPEPSGDPSQAAPTGSRVFRKVFEVPADRAITKAQFVIAADNTFELRVNGRAVASGDSWKRPARVDLASSLRPGPNVVAVLATNASDRPNPAGLLGRLLVTFASGPDLVLPIDASWKAHVEAAPGWDRDGFDDSVWKPSKPIAALGGGPWGRIEPEAPTLSPVAADPFLGDATLPPGTNLDPSRVRVCLELEGVEPEAAARVAVNGEDVGGVIGRPLRLDVTSRIKPGANSFRIEPFAPKAARPAFYPVR